MKNQIIVSLVLLLFISGCNNAGNRVNENKKPNIIYIMADDLGYADLGCYGQEIIQTPNIDKLASQGMKFTQHYAANTVCAPSRCGLMTGMHMGHAEVRGNKQVEPFGQMPISDTTVTVAEMMKEAGYATSLIGKWGLGVENTSGEPDKQGFDMYYGYLEQVLAHNPYPEYLLRNGKREYLTNKVQYLDPNAWHKGLESYTTEKKEYAHDLFTSEALKYIEQKKDTSFFLYLAYILPHANGGAPAGKQQEVPEMAPYENMDWPHDQKAYAAMITRMDRSVGAIMDKLSELGLDENTVVMFVSDNGPMHEYIKFTKFFNSNGPFRGYKRDMYEGGLRVPFIVRWTDKIEPGSTSDHVSAMYDFFPTACELAGVEAPGYIDGISFLPELLGKDQPQHDYLYWEFPSAGGKQAIRKDNWKAVRNNLLKNPEAPIELYNLDSDISESNDIAEENPEIVDKLDQLMKEARTDDPDWKLFGD